MGQLAQWVDWNAQSGVALRAPESYEARRGLHSVEEPVETPILPSNTALVELAERAYALRNFEAPTDLLTDLNDGFADAFDIGFDDFDVSSDSNSSAVAERLSPFVVGDPDDDDVPPTLRSPAGLLQLAQPAPESGELIVAPPMKRSRPVLVVEAALPASAREYIEVW